MKHKLINRKTNEEHLCEKVTIDGWDYYVSDEKYIEGELLYCAANSWLQKARVEHLVEQRGEDNQWKKVIATNDPSIDIPKVVDEVEELASLEEAKEYSDVDPFDPCGYSGTDFNLGYQKGYNKSQETRPFSEDDMIEFYKWVNQPHPEDNSQPSAVYVKNIDMWWYNHKKYTSKELLQLWKSQRPQVIYYE